MHIIWHGQSCFQLVSSRSKGEQISIAIDPFDETIGLRVPSLPADILLITHDHPDHNNKKAVKGTPFLINGPGEYEIKEVFIRGISAFHPHTITSTSAKGTKKRSMSSFGVGVNDDLHARPSFAKQNLGGQGTKRGQNTIYVIEAEEMRICHLGDLGQGELTAEQLEKIGDIDILMIPVGGVYTISAKEAQKIISQIEPRIIIPMHYYLLRMKVRLEKVDNFLKAMGKKSIESQNKLLIKKKDLPAEETKIVVLKP